MISLIAHVIYGVRKKKYIKEMEERMKKDFFLNRDKRKEKVKKRKKIEKEQPKYSKDKERVLKSREEKESKGKSRNKKR